MDDMACHHAHVAEGVQVARRPNIEQPRAAELALSLFGADASHIGLKELGSHQDRNFKIWLNRPDSYIGFMVFKVCNQLWPAATLGAQDAALLHIASKLKTSSDTKVQSVTIPRPLAALDGSFLSAVELEDGMGLGKTTKHWVRGLTFLEGAPLTFTRHISDTVVADLGNLAGTAAWALSDFRHEGLERPGGQWDLRRGVEVTKSLLPSIDDAAKHQAVVDALDAVSAALSPLLARLRVQAIHGDVTDDNVVATRDEAGRMRPNGIIDFGDLGHGWLVAELAVTCSCVLRHRPDEPLAIVHAVRAFHSRMPLSEDEIAALWPLILLRGAVLVTSGEHQAKLDPDNPSATEPLESEWRIFNVARSVPFAVADAAIRIALGMSVSDKYAPQLDVIGKALPLFPGLDPNRIARVDLSATSHAIRCGSHLEGPATEIGLLKEAAKLSGVACTRWNEARITRSAVHSVGVPATVALGVDIVLPAGTKVAAPWDATTSVSDVAGITLSGSFGRLLLTGVTPFAASGFVAAGSELGVVDTDGLVHAMLCVDNYIHVPHFIAPGLLRAGYTAICPDPSVMFGCVVAAFQADPADLLARRAAHLARVQEHYYAAPMQMERGWKEYLIDCDGRTYVDMVNNVAAIGHSHPRLAAAVNAQMHLLNTNSRFHYAAVADLCEQLTSTTPKELDTVLLVNSGSEAVDLALRIAQVVTGRQDIIAVLEAYHGWTLMSDAVTTSLYDSPHALETRPDWIHLAASPNSFRGKFRGEDAKTGYAAEMRGLVDGMVSKGRPPAAFICEPLFGNAGGIILPPGYLATTYDAVRAAGGLCVADEVQVGYGRTGLHWWAHEAHGVVPDIITVAKAMGNGYPLGAVITKKWIADAFQKMNARFFSSAGGSPVSCVVGSTVLEIFRDERLQSNAKTVGDLLIQECNKLAEKYPIIGAVHGSGLYLGVELVKDQVTLEPATAECYAICERLRELGCIVQPTGERANILKMKPPMCLTKESAMFFIQALTKTLNDGW